MKLHLQRPIVVFDLETTGVQITRDRIVEISILKVHPDGEQETKTRRINPEMPIPQEATAVHGITDADVADCPTFTQVARSLYSWIEGCDIAGFNSNRFDVPMLVEEFLRAGVAVDFDDRHFIDVQTIYHKMERRTLEAAYKFYCSKTLENAHSAEADTRATFEVLEAQLDHYPEELTNDVAALAEFSSYGRRVDFAGSLAFDDQDEIVINFGKYKGVPVTEVFLTRLLVRQGAEVQIVITPAGKEFITPITLSALSSRPVISEFFSGLDGTWNSHVDIGLWADAMVIAPATASTIGKMAHGVADNMLLTTYLSMKAPVFVAPAMDLDMFAHPSTTDNLDLLAQRGNFIIEPQSGELASHLIGKGRMEEPEGIVAVLEEFFSSTLDYEGKRVVITAGPTHEAIDPVRFIGNHSTGRMGIALADELVRRGAHVDLILGPSALKPSDAVHVERVTTAEEMLRATEAVIDTADIAIFAAAVADYRPHIRHTEKIKREHETELDLELVRNPDIAATLGARKRPDQFFVGFALESNAGVDEAKRKMQAKGFDAIVLNSLQDSGAGFGHETNKVTIFDQEGSIEAYELKSKDAVARDIASFIIKRLG